MCVSELPGLAARPTSGQAVRACARAAGLAQRAREAAAVCRLPPCCLCPTCLR